VLKTSETEEKYRSLCDFCAKQQFCGCAKGAMHIDADQTCHGVGLQVWELILLF
jgi:hypothetical protein